MGCLGDPANRAILNEAGAVASHVHSGWKEGVRGGEQPPP